MLSIDVATLKTWQEQSNVHLIDVREPEEFSDAAIPGAVLIPLAQFKPEMLTAYTGKPIVIHCKSGGRSGRACALVAASTPNVEVHNLTGGITAWMAAGYPLA